MGINHATFGWSGNAILLIFWLQAARASYRTSYTEICLSRYCGGSGNCPLFSCPNAHSSAKRCRLRPSPTASARTPAVLLIHGGGWVGGEKDGLAELCHYFAEKGILAASVEYRLADGRNENRWPAQLVDVQLAVRWLRTNAYELGIDPYHICAYGNSAGGHLATWLLIEQSIRPGDYAGELQAVSPEISCAITNSGPVDFSMLPPSFDSVLSLLAPLECKGSRECTVAELSPLASINKTLASPLLISHGRHDELVPIEQATKLLAALEHFHSAVSFINYDGAHEFLETSSSVQRKVLALQLDFIKHGNAR